MIKIGLYIGNGFLIGYVTIGNLVGNVLIGVFVGATVGIGLGSTGYGAGAIGSIRSMISIGSDMGTAIADTAICRCKS